MDGWVVFIQHRVIGALPRHTLGSRFLDAESLEQFRLAVPRPCLRADCYTRLVCDCSKRADGWAVLLLAEC